MIFRTETVIGLAIKIGAGTRVPIYTGVSGQAIEITHGLGRVPVDIAISDKDNWCDFYTVSKDAYKHVAVFSEARVQLYLRYE